jgi:hypothetical protein
MRLENVNGLTFWFGICIYCLGVLAGAQKGNGEQAPSLVVRSNAQSVGAGENLLRQAAHPRQDRHKMLALGQLG